MWVRAENWKGYEYSLNAHIQYVLLYARWKSQENHTLSVKWVMVDRDPIQKYDKAEPKPVKLCRFSPISWVNTKLRVKYISNSYYFYFLSLDQEGKLLGGRFHVYPNVILVNI